MPEYLNTLTAPGIPPHTLRIRLNAVVMLVRNLSVKKGLCNGTRLQIIDMGKHVIRAKVFIYIK